MDDMVELSAVGAVPNVIVMTGITRITSKGITSYEYTGRGRAISLDNIRLGKAVDITGLGNIILRVWVVEENGEVVITGVLDD